MEPTTWLLFLSVAMFAGAFLAGLVPLMCSLAPSRVRTLSVLGAGLLIGTALIVVIPEGVHVFYETAGGAVEHHAEAAPLSEEAIVEAMEFGGGLPGAGDHDGHDHDHDHGGEGGHSHGDGWQIGGALAAGFVAMLLIDHMSGSGGGHGHAHGVVDPEAPSPNSPARGEEKPAAPASSARSMSATLGLLVHAGVDGIALGSAALSNNGSLSFIVFVAIMLHKAPAAFGLASYLLQQGLSVAAVRQRLLWFAGVAPVCSILTYSTLSFSGEMNLRTLALLLIFSGGTFLYVSTCHILPELSVSAPLRKADVCVLVAGILLPLIPAMMDLEHGH